MRRLRIIMVIALLAISQNAYAQNREISAQAIKPIELPQTQGKLRIVALANGSAEIVSALGLRSSLVGRDIASTTPELRSVPIVTAGHQVVPEKIISLKPDVVIIDSGSGPQSAIKTLKTAKIKVSLINEAWKVSEIYNKISQIGTIVGDRKRAQELNTRIKTTIGQSSIDIKWKPRVVFLYLRGPSSIYLMGGPGSGADSLIHELGGIDVGAQLLKNPFNSLTSEALISANPDIFLVMTKGLQSVGGVTGFVKLPGVAQTKAGKNRTILSVDDSLLLSFGPRTPNLLVAMAEAFKGFK